MKKNELWEMISACAGTVMLKGKPGMAKSAIIEQLAKENGYHFVDLRLPMMDEVDVGGMTTKVEKEVAGKKILTTVVAYPEWALETHERKTLIVFEELNRCSLYVRNAALGILNERRIGNFKLGEDTVLVATGNLGDEDGCEVEEFDQALRGRIVHINYDMNYKEWMDGYARENVDESITAFLEANPTCYYKASDDGAYASPRTWSFLSKYITKLRDNGMGDSQILGRLRKHGQSYVGSSSVELCSFLEARYECTIDDILKGKDYGKLVRPDMTRLLADMKSAYPDFKLSSAKKYDNFVKFLKDCDSDFAAEWIIATVQNPGFNEDDCPKGWEIMKTTAWLAKLGKEALATNS
jgi:hypothetical protein